MTKRLLDGNAVDRFIEASNVQSEQHRIAYGQEMFNMGVDASLRLIERRYGYLLASGIEKTNPDQWAAVSIELYSLIEQVSKLKKPTNQ